MTPAHVATRLIAKHGRAGAYMKAGTRWMIHAFSLITRTPFHASHEAFWSEVCKRCEP